MRQLWKTTIVAFVLAGIAAVAAAAAISDSAARDDRAALRAAGRMHIVMAQYELGMALGR